jgi:hypothetical protein
MLPLRPSPNLHEPVPPKGHARFVVNLGAVPQSHWRETSLKHGLWAMKRAIRELSTRAIDGRTSVAKALAEWRRQLIHDLGGRETISTQQIAIIDLATKTKLILDSVDVWLLTQRSLVDKRRRTILPVVRERQQLADALARYLVQLGLERRQPATRSLADVMDEITAEKERTAGTEYPERLQPSNQITTRKEKA